MVTKPTVEAVQRLLPRPLETALIESVIDDAVALLGPCKNRYEAETETAIVKYLAAHLLSVTQAGAMVKSENVDGSSYTLQTGALGQGLAATSFGQQAMALDYEGCLANRDKQSVQLKLL